MPTPDGPGTAAAADADAGAHADADAAPAWNRLAGLGDLTGRPLAEHADVYQALHADLQAALAEIDSA